MKPLSFLRYKWHLSNGEEIRTQQRFKGQKVQVCQPLGAWLFPGVPPRVLKPLAGEKDSDYHLDLSQYEVVLRAKEEKVLENEAVS